MSFFFSALLLLSLAAADAAVSGQVLDPSGAVLPGARVTFRARGVPDQVALSDRGGMFAFEGVPPGSYEVLVEAESFQRATVTVRVGARPPRPLRIVLRLAERRDEVIAVDRAEEVRTSTADNLDVVLLDRALLDDLPVLGNDIIGSASRFLDPGALGTGGVTLVVDGMQTSEKGVSASAIQEVRINQNPYSAEFPRPGRGRIEVFTKPGGTEYHGTFNFILRDYHLDARNAFAAVRPEEQRRIFEGHLTGPLGKSGKTSWLISANREELDLESVVFARTLGGLVQENVPAPERTTELSARVNHQVGKKNLLSFRYELARDSADGRSIGGFTLPEAGTRMEDNQHHLYYSHRSVITPRLIHELFVRAGTHHNPTRSIAPGRKIVVLDAFTAGGAQADRLSTENHVQFNESLAWSHGKHLIKTGVNLPDWSRRGSNDRGNREGTYSFSTLDDYARGAAYLFVVQQGEGRVVFWQKDLGVFLQDDIRLRPNLSLALGLRYDWQNFVADRNNLAPRLGFAFAPGKGRKTVLRGGAGWFFDRTGPGPVADTLRYDGLRLRQLVITDPPYPDPRIGDGADARPPSVVRFAPDLRSPYQMQWSLGAERRLRKSTTASVTYIESHGTKLFRSRDLNSPLAPDYRRPDSVFGIVRQIESSASSRSRSLELTLRGDITRFWSGSLQYTTGRAYSDTAGVSALPADSRDLSGEWSRADFDERQRFHALGTFRAAKLFRLGIALQISSGRPYTLTSGRDDNHDGTASDRPRGVTRNTLQGPGYAALDLRWSRDVWHGAGTKDKAPSVTVGIDLFNALNRVNYGGYVGNLSSPFFGLPVSARPARRVQVTLRGSF